MRWCKVLCAWGDVNKVAQPLSVNLPGLRCNAKVVCVRRAWV